MGVTRDVIKAAAVYSGASVFERIVSFILLPFYAHIFATEGYGIIGLVDASVGLLAIAFANGFHIATVRTYYEEPEERRRSVISTAIVLVWIFGLVLVPLPMILSPWLASVLLGDRRHWILIAMALTTLLIDVGGKSASTYLVIRQRSVLYSTVGLIRMILGVSLNVVLVLILKVGLVGIFIASLVTAAVSASIFVTVAVWGQGLTFDRSIARRLCAFQLPLVPAEVVAFASRQTERFLVRFLVSLEGVGVLEMAYKFPPTLNMFFVSPFMLSWRTKSVELAEGTGSPRFMGRVLTGFVFLLLLAGLMMAVNIPDVLVLLTPPDFWQAAHIAQIEIVTTILAGLGTFMQFGLMYRKRTKQLAVIKSSVACAKVAASVFLIRMFGLSGAAYSALLMEFVTLTWVWRSSQALYPIEIETRWLVLLATSAVALFLATIYVDHLSPGPIDALARTLIPPIIELVRHSPLAAWRSGRFVAYLVGRERVIAELAVNSLIALSFAGMIGLFHPTTVRDAVAFIRRQRPATSPTA